MSTFIALLMWIEESWLARMVGETQWGFPLALTLHALGMGMLAGGNIVLALRLLGVAPSLPAHTLLRCYPLLWACAGLSTLSGLLLFSAYPAKALTNPLFFAKLAMIALGLYWLARPLRQQLLATTTRAPQPWIGVVAIALWLATITSGRLLAYTNVVLRASELQVN